MSMPHLKEVRDLKGIKSLVKWETDSKLDYLNRILMYKKSSSRWTAHSIALKTVGVKMDQLVIKMSTISTELIP